MDVYVKLYICAVQYFRYIIIWMDFLNNGKTNFRQGVHEMIFGGTFVHYWNWEQLLSLMTSIFTDISYQDIGKNSIISVVDGVFSANSAHQLKYSNYFWFIITKESGAGICRHYLDPHLDQVWFLLYAFGVNIHRLVMRWPVKGWQYTKCMQKGKYLI